MARANTITGLSLDRFFAVLGINPLHGNQVGLPNNTEIFNCDGPILQHSWQTADRISREEIAMAIYDAEHMIADFTNFDVGIRWNEAEEHNVCRGTTSIVTNKKFVIAGGKKTVSLRSAGVAVAYSDSNGDTYKDKATISYNNGVDIAESEVAIFYPGKDEAWRIRPITVTVNHTTFDVVVTAKREQFVIESAMEMLYAREVDGANDANFLTTVDVYRIWNDDTKQVEFISNSCVVCDDGTCAETINEGCLRVTNSRLGIAGLRYLNYDCVYWPTKVRLWYKAGIEDSQWERAVAYLALSLLDRPICTCKSMEQVSRHWQEDLALRVSGGGRSTSRVVGRLNLDNPFGTTRAGIYVWNLVSRLSVGA